MHAARSDEVRQLDHLVADRNIVRKDQHVAVGLRAAVEFRGADVVKSRSDAHLRAKQSLGALASQVVNQASTQAALDLFWLFGVLCFVMVPLIWITRKSISGGGPVAAD